MSLASPPAPPSTPAALHAWITSSPPYHLTTFDHFPGVHDFTIRELQDALHHAVHAFRTAKAELKAIVQGMESRQVDKALAHAFDVLEFTSMGPIANIPPRSFPRLVLAAKIADDLGYQRCLTGLAIGIRLFQEETGWMRRVQQVASGELQVEKGKGDEDDWFVVENEEQGLRDEQDELFAEIEIQLGVECWRCETATGG